MKKFIITIARQYGSEGSDIGRRLAEKLGYEFYDKKLITMAAKESGFDPDVLSDIDEKATSSLLYSLSYGYSVMSDGMSHVNLPLNDKLFAIQSDIIRTIAEKDEGAVIVGRCADYVLSKNENVVKVYVFSDFDRRVERVATELSCSTSKAKDEVIRIDKKRAGYYNYYTGKKWGRIENYDLVINMDKTGIDGAVSVIESFLQNV